MRPAESAHWDIVTRLFGSTDVIVRDPVAVMLARCPDELSEIQRLWPWFENLVGLRGRKMYATADVSLGVYTTCTPIRAADDPSALGLRVGQLPSGRFRRGRLRGEPPGIYALIGAGFEELEATIPAADRRRPLVEYYKRHDEIELWVPVPDQQGAR
jgi:hypothetical protein